MNQRTVIARETAATEAVISRDGRIKRRIPNFETVVINIAESNSQTGNLHDAINDTQADLPAEIPVLLDTIEIMDNDPQNKSSNKKFGIVLLGVIVFITFLWSMYSLFYPPESQPTLSVQRETGSEEYQVDPIQKVKQLSDLILHDGDWNDLRLTSIMQYWDHMQPFEQDKLNKLTWFQHFKFSIDQQVKQRTKSEKNKIESFHNTSLYKLAVLVNAINNQDPKPGSKVKYQSVIDAIKKDIANAELTAKHSQQNAESEEKLNSKLRKELASPDTEIKNVPVIDADVKTLLDKYQKAYENGDLPVISELFGLSRSTGTDHNLIANFENIFKNTSKRSLNFYDYSWKPTASGAVINSKYNATLEFANKKGTQNIVTNAKIIVNQKAGLLNIVSFELQNSKVSVTTPKLALPDTQSSKSNRSNSEIPNAAQLQDLTTQLVSAYESGDIERFTALFSDDVKTNDRMNLSGVRQDYSQLFQTSNDRQMFIQNLSWVDVDNGAKGTGDLEVIVLSNNSENVYSMKGKIQIVAQLINGKTLITHLYHIERQR